MLLLDTNNGALRRLLLLPDAQESPKRTSWWSNKEEMVRNSTCLYYTVFFKIKAQYWKNCPRIVYLSGFTAQALNCLIYVCLNALNMK